VCVEGMTWRHATQVGAKCGYIMTYLGIKSTQWVFGRSAFGGVLTPPPPSLFEFRGA